MTPLDKAKPVKLTPAHIKWLGDNFKLSREVGLAPEEIQQAIPGLTLLDVPKFTPIIRELDKGEDLFVLQQGEVSVNKIRKFLGGVEVVRLQPGDYFGEIALIGRVERTATVTAEKDCKVFQLPADQVRALLDKNPKLAEHIKKVAAERLQKLAEIAK